MSRCYKISLICGAAPLFVGIAIFLLWLITRWDWLMAAGVLTIYGGFAAFILGVISLAMSPEPRRTRPMLACTALLLVNFPVAIAISLTAVDLATRYTVVVHNNSQKTLKHVRLAGGGCDVSIGTMLPGESDHRTMHFREDGQLEFHATWDTTARVAVVEGYVTGNMGGHAIVHINTDGRISHSAAHGTDD